MCRRQMPKDNSDWYSYRPCAHCYSVACRYARDLRRKQHQLFMGGVEEAVPVSEPVVRALEEANTLKGRGRGQSFAVRLDPLPATPVM